VERHNSFPEPPDDSSDSPEEIEETSVDDVIAELQRIDEHLITAGQIVPPKEDEDLEITAGVPDFSEISERSLKRFVKDLRGVWTRLGLVDPEKCTFTKFSSLDPEVMLQLDVYTAELLFFDTAKKVWQKLGSEPVRTDMILGQLQQSSDPSTPTKRVDLVRLRSEQRDEAFTYLGWIGIDREELTEMLLGSPQQQQNVIRLSYVLSEEPALGQLRNQYAEETKTLEEPRMFEKVAKKVRNELKNYIYLYKEDRRRLSQPEAAMEYLDHVTYERAMNSAEKSLGLIELVLEDIKA